ncbi:DUF222 domain-containing protein [Microbacterium sp. gxy059]|uniref:DUF222 domain-containing protein n=1 Tax=Microbacterium sp. gxy059 TaxID=2957199 RepID=UPI003D979E62
MATTHTPDTGDLTPAERRSVNDCLDRVIAAERAIAREQAVLAEARSQLADIADRQRERLGDTGGHDVAGRAMAAELAAAVRVSPRTAQAHLSEAQSLVHDFPAAVAALHAGRMSASQARAVAAEGLRLPTEIRPEYARDAVDAASSATPGQTRRIAQKVAESLDPEPLRERHHRARQDRRVAATPVGDGMSELWALLPTPIAEGVFDRLTRMARTVRDDRRAVAREQAKTQGTTGTPDAAHPTGRAFGVAPLAQDAFDTGPASTATPLAQGATGTAPAPPEHGRVRPSRPGAAAGRHPR